MEQPEGETGFEQLVRIVARLRGPGGCPWDQAQTPRSFRPYLIEEAYEVVDAIDRAQPAELKKELGDLLFQIVILAQMAEEDGAFDMDDVARGISEKMIRRHPHVFDPGFDPEKENPSGIAAWERRKARERPADASALDGVPTAMPALLRAHRVSDKAAGVGFDWPDRASVRAKVGEELQELDEALAAGDEAHILEEYGDLLFALVNLGRKLPVGAEDALRAATLKFEGRFRRLEAAITAEGGSIHDTPLDEPEARWQAAKQEAG